MLLLERGAAGEAHLRSRRCHCQGRKQRPQRLRAPSGSFPAGSLGSRRPCIATAWASLARGHFASPGRKVSGKWGLSDRSTAQLPKPPQTKTPALPAERSARAAWLPGEEGTPRPTLTPAMQCALPSGPFPPGPAEKLQDPQRIAWPANSLALAQSR